MTPALRTVLLILPSRYEIIPVSTVALTQAQASRQELKTGYSDAYLLDVDGTLRRIEDIEVLGPWGESWARKLLSRLTSGWRISVRLSDPVHWDLGKLKSVIHDSLAAGSLADESTGSVPAGVIDAVKNVTGADQVFAALRLPPPSEALDVL